LEEMGNASPMRAAIGTDTEEAGIDILVVDDNPRNLLAIDAALGHFQGRIVKAKSGEDALRALLRQDFAVILLDVQMPGLDGFETAQLIRMRERCKHTPIIFVTAFDQKREDVLRGYELGAIDFLFKPITPEILRAKVAGFVELRRHVAEIARQEKLLREHERREQEDRLAEAKRRWEADLLRKNAEENAQRAEQLALIVYEREKAQAELTSAYRELERSDRRKSEFLATLAHELRTPLSPIAVGIDLLRQLAPNDAEVEKVLDAMKRQSVHLVRLVDDLLELSRISRGKIELQRGTLVLADAIEQAVQMCRPLFDEREHTLEVVACPDRLFVDGDRVRLTQIVNNLLTNAARYTPPHGRVRLEWAREGEGVLLRVTDNGRGMSPELIARVFDIFVQGDGDNSGLGIGLSLVKQLVELHGGSVEAASPGENRGSTFTVRLPLLPAAVHEEPAETGTRLRSANPEPPGLQVLVIEDNEDIRELTCSMLARAGHDVESADDGEQGLSLAVQQAFDVALVDIGLPGIGGVEVGRRLREILGSATRLVAVTGYGHAQAKSAAASAGFDAYLIKPVGQKELEAELAEARVQRDASALDSAECASE
jgi:two-component system, sensor histidine kinase